ncbi:unnamed protein product [Rotaria magnacalcarata]
MFHQIKRSYLKIFLCYYDTDTSSIHFILGYTRLGYLCIWIYETCFIFFVLFEFVLKKIVFIISLIEQ